MNEPKQMHLQEKIFLLLRQQILDGALSSGTRLLPSRVMAEELGVSRNTVLVAVERLVAEGYVVAKTGSGCYVNDNVALGTNATASLGAIAPTGFMPYRSDIVDFKSGLPDLSVFPVKRFGQLYRDVMDHITPAELGYGAPEGHIELRREIATYLQTYRGVRCDPASILITSGTTQAIGIAGSALFEGQSHPLAVIENPITVDIRRILQKLGAEIYPVPTDQWGLCTSALPSHKAPRCIYVTPSHQYPLGAILSAKRRVKLIEYAQKSNCYIVEDDYDSEYRFDGHPISAVQGLCPKRVIYIGTFSKTLSPALRIGYLVLPPSLIAGARQMKWLTDLHNSVFDQLVLARFIRGGHYYRHLMKMKKRYRSKRDFLLACLQQHMGERAKIIGENAGLHLCVQFPGVVFSKNLLDNLEQAGVRVYPVWEHAGTDTSFDDTIILGFGMLSPEKIDKGIGILKQILL